MLGFDSRGLILGRGLFLWNRESIVGWAVSLTGGGWVSISLGILNISFLDIEQVFSSLLGMPV